jgi:lipopolysaccharide/colanic/teichoic acid biosynthesis glycosyltransferase
MYRINKRVFDFLASLSALLILSPLFCAIIVILLFTGEHQVFFLQRRVGHRNSRFHVFKFVTMVKNSPNIGTGNITVRNDPRVLPVGRFLRKTKLNELPQIVNVLVGQMSVVGPRPLAESGFEKYPADIQSCIYNVKPGLTGIGSVIFRDEENILHGRTPEELRTFYVEKIMPYKGALELWYQENLSFATDMKIIFLTAWVIFFPKSELPYKWFKNLPERPEFLK